MKACIILLTAILFAACNSATNTGTGADTAGTTDTLVTNGDPLPAGDACFLHLEGSENQDTILAELNFSGSTVTGRYNWVPSEKDSRKGTISATRSGDKITGLWTYTQEGTLDSLPVEFMLKNDALYQKVYQVDAKTGRQYIDRKSAFGTVFSKVDCGEY